jgi:uncharacterized Zn-finger protein
LIQRQDELDIILQSVSVAEEYEEDDIIEEYLDDDEDNEEKSEAQDLRTKFIEKPSVKNLSQKPNKHDILKLIEDIEKNNQLIYENSKPTVLWKKRKPRAMKPRQQQQQAEMPITRIEPLLIETPEPKLILKPYDDEQSSISEYETETEGSVVVHHDSYSCAFKDCNQSFHSDFLLKLHSKTHPIEPIKCCNNSFDSLQDYKNHKRTFHAEAIVCKSCGKVLKSQKTYRIHLKSHLSATDRKYKCDRKNCTKAFNMKVHLENHLRIHSNHCPFECPLPYCSTSFKQKHQVRLHLRNKHNINSSTVSSSEIDDIL